MNAKNSKESIVASFSNLSKKNASTEIQSSLSDFEEKVVAIKALDLLAANPACSTRLGLDDSNNDFSPPDIPLAILDYYSSVVSEADGVLQSIKNVQMSLDVISKTCTSMKCALEPISPESVKVGKDFLRDSLAEELLIKDLEIRAKEANHYITEFFLTPSEMRFLSSPSSDVCVEFFTALDRAFNLLAKIKNELGFPETKLSLDLTEMCETHIETAFERLDSWVKSSMVAFRNIIVIEINDDSSTRGSTLKDPNLFCRAMQHIEKRGGARLTLLADELSYQRSLALQTWLDDISATMARSSQKNERGIDLCSTLISWLRDATNSEFSLWGKLGLSSNTVVNIMSKSFTVISRPLHKHFDEALSSMMSYNDPIIFLRTYCSFVEVEKNLGSLLSSTPRISETLKQTQQTATKRLCDSIELKTKNICKEAIDSDVSIDKSKIVCFAKQILQEIQKTMQETTIEINDFIIKPSVDALVDPCIQTCIILSSDLESHVANISLINAFQEILVFVEPVMLEKTNSIKKQIQIFVDALVKNLSSKELDQSGLKLLFDLVNSASAPGGSLIALGYDDIRMKGLLRDLDIFLVAGLIEIRRALSSLRIRRMHDSILENLNELFLQHYEFIYNTLGRLGHVLKRTVTDTRSLLGSRI